MHHSIPAEHAQHDVDLIAGHAAGDLTDPDRIRAETLLNSCASCAELRRDLLAIATATRNLPSPAAASRDFRLTPAQAARLRRGNRLTSLLRPFAAPSSAVRPLAMAFTSLGLAGLLVTNILPALLGGAGATGAFAPEAAPGGAQPPAGAAAATAAPAPVPAGPQSSDGRAALGASTAPVVVLDQGGSGGSKSSEATTPPDFAANEYQASGRSGEPSYDRLAAGERQLIVEDETNPVFIGSLLLIALGLALFGLRFVARRVR